MDTGDLEELVPGLMGRHPGHTWVLLSPGGPGQDLRGEVRLIADPSRIAVVQVNAGAEVFHVDFAGHTNTDFAYDDGDRLEAFQECIDLAAAVTRGPTRVTLGLVGDVVVRSRLVVDPDGPSRLEGGAVSYPLRRLEAFFRGEGVVERVVDLPAIDD